MYRHAPARPIVAQYCLILMAWYGGFMVLGPAVARSHLGGPAAWGAITAAESVGLIAGGLLSLRFSPRRPMLFVVLMGMTIAVPTLSLAMLWPLPVIAGAPAGRRADKSPASSQRARAGFFPARSRPRVLRPRPAVSSMAS